MFKLPVCKLAVNLSKGKLLRPFADHTSAIVRKKDLQEEPVHRGNIPARVLIALAAIMAVGLAVLILVPGVLAASFKVPAPLVCARQDASTSGYVVQRCIGRHLVGKTIKVRLTGYSGYRFKLVARCGTHSYNSGMKLYHTDKPVVVRLPRKIAKAINDAPVCRLYFEGSAYVYRGKNHKALFSTTQYRYYLHK